MKKIYPAIFHEESDGGYWVTFPDIKGCITDGNTLEEAMQNAEEVLGVFIATKMEEKLAVDPPSAIETIHAEDGFTTYVSADIDRYRRNTKAVRKTLSIPKWLSDEAERQHISLSSVLQNALRRELNIG
jgi:predicted RNase H-like HicB family nuclease